MGRRPSSARSERAFARKTAGISGGLVEQQRDGQPHRLNYGVQTSLEHYIDSDEELLSSVASSGAPSRGSSSFT